MIAGNLVRALGQLFHMLMQIYIFVIILRAIVSWLGNIPANSLTIILRRMTDPLFRLVHRIIPFSVIGGIDISPVIILVILYFIDNVVTGIIMGYAGRLLAGG